MDQNDDEIMEYTELDDERCGCYVPFIGRKRCKLVFLEKFNNSKGALVFLSMAVFMQAITVNGFVNVGISTIERRFHLRSSETGMIVSSYDIAFCLPLLLVTYLGGRGHKPMWCASGVLLLAMGSLFYSLPHFIAPTYSGFDKATDQSVCNSTDQILCKESSLRNYRYLFIFAQVFNGLGSCPLYTLALTYLDENVSQVQSSTYHAIFLSCGTLGPAFGYSIGGAILHVYTNINEDVDFDPTSSLWVGAWWIALFVSSLVLFLLTMPVSMYPRQLPNTNHLRQNREQEVQHTTDNYTDLHVSKDITASVRFRDLPAATFKLMKNSTLVFLSLGGAMDSALVAGIAAFGPKYLETMFGFTAGNAAICFGILAVVGGCSGQLLGGHLISRFDLSVRSMIKLCFGCAGSAIFVTFGFLMPCPEEQKFAGETVPYKDELLMSGITSTCNSNCSCSLEVFHPVCGEDQVTYFSSCFAGCSAINITTGLDCQCVQPSINSSQIGGVVTSGICETTPCLHTALFIFLLFLGFAFTFLNSIPALQATLRIVPFQQRSLAIGVQSVILRIAGSIPGPIILGQVLDYSCLVWNEECGVNGSCKLYGKTALSKYMFTVIIIFKALSTIFYIISWRTYKPKYESDKIPIAFDTESSQVDLNLGR